MCKIPALQQSLEKNNKNCIIIISFTKYRRTLQYKFALQIIYYKITVFKLVVYFILNSHSIFKEIYFQTDCRNLLHLCCEDNP